MADENKSATFYWWFSNSFNEVMLGIIFQGFSLSVLWRFLSTAKGYNSSTNPCAFIDILIDKGVVSTNKTMTIKI